MTQPVPFGKYYLLERINVGGMAEVFKAKAFGVEGFERLLALKRILPNIAEDEEFITMFIDEAKIAVQLQHANIAQIFDLGKVDDSFFIALEYVHGKDLRAIFDHFRKVGERMPAAQVCYVMMQVCEGLDYAHNKRDGQGRELGLVHRDVSPQNVLVGYEGEIKLIDFGIAKAAGKASKTQAGILKGKFGYMSPEQVRGLPVDRRSDVFAAGICLYELLTGERLFVGESDFSTLEKVRNVEILPPSSFNKRIAPELERIVLKALAKDAEDRYQNAIDLHDELQAYLYSTGEFFSRKDLASWMKKTFAAEIAEESARNAQYEQLEQPTPLPFPGAHDQGHEARKGSGSQPRPGLDWDDDELETQIFDRLPGGAAAAQVGADDDPNRTYQDGGYPEERASELSSSDILLPDMAAELAADADRAAREHDHQSIDNLQDDKTAIAPPPDEAALAYDTPSGGYAQGIQPNMLGGPMPRPNTQPNFGSTLLGATAPMPQLPPGPPPGLSAYRTTGQMPVQGGWAPQPAPQNPNQNGQSYAGQGQPGSPFRQTIMGLQPHQPLTPAYQPPPPPPATYDAKAGPGVGPRKRFPVAAAIAVVLLALGGMVLFNVMNRPSKLVLDVSPSGAAVTFEGTALKGIPPFSLEKPPGTYKVIATLDGYTKEERRVELEPGGTQKLKIDLRPSPDTGFELTSDPPGQLVWMDGNPFTGVDPNGPQARTDFKATRVPPGRHLLEIKGDPRFRPWRYEFYQEPGKLIQIRAALQIDNRPGAKQGLFIPLEQLGKTPLPGATTPPKPPVAVAPAPPPVTPPPPATPAPRPPVFAPPTPTPAAPSASTPPPPRPTAPPPVTPPPPRPATTPPPVATTPPRPVPTPRPAATPRPPVAAAPDPAAPAADPAAAAARAGGNCSVTIGSKPWAEVWIDGRNTQKLTPLVDFKVPCGRHRVTLKNPELQIEKNEAIVVKSGEKWKKIFQLLDEE